MPEEIFKIRTHSFFPWEKDAKNGKHMVEYWRDGKFIAGIYPHQDGIRVVSKYITGASMEEKPVPAAVIKLEV
ncbi:hypothetical protein ES707_21665 [subsurface metagenome]